MELRRAQFQQLPPAQLRQSGRGLWVIDNTAILHFCGRAKPWKPGYPYRFGILYKHYARLAQKWIAG